MRNGGTDQQGGGGIDAAFLGARRAWFGVLFLLSREAKASSASFVITTLADLLQFSVFPMVVAASLLDAATFQAVATVLSIAILDVDTLFALADANSGAGRAVLFWLALAIVVIFLGMLAYVMGTIITEGRQQAIVLRALASLASVLTTVAFMPAASLLLSVFHSCASVEALGVGCQTDGHWIVIALVVTVLTVFTAVATFFATVYIDTDLKATALGAKVTGRVDAAMLVAKLVLVVFFTAVKLPPVIQTVLAAAAALTWLCGTVFVQPYVQPTANNVSAAAAALNTWLVLAVAVRLLAPRSSIDAFMFLGLALAPALGYFGNEAYRSSVANSDFSSLRSSLQADIWARHRVALAQRFDAASGPGGMHGVRETRGQQRRRMRSAASQGEHGALMGSRGSARDRRRQSALGDGARSTKRSMGRAPSLSSVLGGSLISPSASHYNPGDAASLAGPPLRVHVLADNGNNSSDSDSDDPVTTEDLLPSVTSERLVRQASMAYDEMLKAWPKSAVTYSSGSIFHRAYGSTASSELTILAMARKQVGSAWDVSFLSYQRTRQLQERSGSGLSAVDRILFDEAWSTAIEETTKAFAAQNKLYNHAVESSPDANRLGLLAEELFKARTAAERRFRTMLQINPDSIMALRAYSRFCEEVLHDADKSTELMNKANRIEDKHAKTNVRPLDAVVVGAAEEPLSVMDEMNAVITMTGELRRYGEITDANVATARLFGRGRSDLMGQSLASLFPEPLGSLYDAAILAYLSPHEKGEAFSRGAHVSVVQTAGGWLAPVRVSLQEGAGSELDATPSLSLVVQRAPTKRRMMVVGDAESGFPVLALDVESMALLGDEAMDDDDDDYDDDVDSTGAPGSEGGGIIGEGGSLRWRQPGGAVGVLASVGGGGTASVIASRELPLVQWLPNLGRLASAAMGSASGATAEMIVRGSMYNDDEEEVVVPAAEHFAVPSPRPAKDTDESHSSQHTQPGGDVDDLLSPMPTGDKTDSSPLATAKPVPPIDTQAATSQQPSGGYALKPARRGSTSFGPGTVTKKAVKLRVGVQALHENVLKGRRPKRDGEALGYWLVTWEPPKGFNTGPAKGSRSRAQAKGPKRSAASQRGVSSAASDMASTVAGVPVHMGSRGRGGALSRSGRAASTGRAGGVVRGRSGRSNTGTGAAASALRSSSQSRRVATSGGSEAGGNSRRNVTVRVEGDDFTPTTLASPDMPDAKGLPEDTIGESEMGDGFDGTVGGPASVRRIGGDTTALALAQTAGSASNAGLDTADDAGLLDFPSKTPGGEDSLRGAGNESAFSGGIVIGGGPGSRAGSRAGGGGDAGSLHSSMTSAGRVTKTIIETALSRGDINVTRIRAVVMASLFAVIMFAVSIALVLPSSDAGAKLLLEANNLAQRRLYQSGTASNVRYQMTSVANGFDVINSWDELAKNLSASVQRLEASHRELLGVAQLVQGKLSFFEQDRSWWVCTASIEEFTCDKRELMSSSELVEFNIYHLRQMSVSTPAEFLQLPSLLVMIANIELSGLALKQAERVSSADLAEGMQSRLDSMTTILIACAVVTFAMATFGTTWLMGALGRQRFRLLASVPQVSRKQLRELARQAENAQMSFVRAVGADTGEDDNGLVDNNDEDGDRSPRADLTGPHSTARSVGGGGGHSATGRQQSARGGIGESSGIGGASASGIGSARATDQVKIVQLGGQSSSVRGSARHADGKAPRRGLCRRLFCCCCGKRGSSSRARRVADSSCFVGKASLKITSPLSLIGAWIAVVLVMVSSMYNRITIDAARSERLHSFAAGTSALRGQLELSMIRTGAKRSQAMENARTNSTRILRSLSGVLNGDTETSYNVRLPSLAESMDPTAGELFEILVHDSCRVLPEDSFFHEECHHLHERFGLSGLLSFTTAMLDDGVQAMSIFDEKNESDHRDLMMLYRSGELAPIIDPLTRYDAKGEMNEIIVRHLVNITAKAAKSRFSSTWSDVQVVLGVFAGGFVLIVWLWALPSVRQLEDSRRALYSVMLTLPDDVILSTPAVTDVLIEMATLVGLTQAARALKSLAKSANDPGRRPFRAIASTSQRRKAAGSQPKSGGTPSSRVGTTEPGMS
ncbi:hypothetical protein FNF27_06411 [Cafeteria roenbergensis]|uniref:TmcB/TmcC TPR repeats domain-containing protein n=1 Tax=Cafeteria roenbergensis TaxID=33653 RepID=A0A5A8E2P6_CAFRO|nr:hypothetical protein FNF27_06411 [Cafeteria roenbergensis]